jgi:hypothetical protein
MMDECKHGYMGRCDLCAFEDREHDDMGGMAGFDWKTVRYEAAEQEVGRLESLLEASLQHEETILWQAAEISKHIDRIAELERRLEEVQKDAERYRWLREQSWDTGLLAVVADPKDAIKLGYDCPSLARLDEQIDAAMLAQRPCAKQYALTGSQRDDHEQS